MKDHFMFNRQRLVKYIDHQDIEALSLEQFRFVQHGYASMQPLVMPPESKESQAFRAEFMQLPIDEVNRIDIRALEKHYSSNRQFALPDYYREPFVR